MPTSIWTHAERDARAAIETSLRERHADTPGEFQNFYRRWGPACVGSALDNLGRPGGGARLHAFVRDAVSRHFAADPVPAGA